jgi:purine-binding chemotaxis protein CheW
MKKGINWNEIYSRIEAARIEVEKGFQPTAEERDKVLKERAKVFSRESEEKRGKDEHIEVLEFLLAHEVYGVELRYVREVYPLKELTPIPGTPPFVLGIVNIRGEILSVIDIKKFFDLPEKGLTDLNKVIILHSPEIEFGILADSILGVRNILLSDIQPSLPTLTGIREEYLKGVTKDRGIVLDAERLLSDKGIIVNEGMKM